MQVIAGGEHNRIESFAAAAGEAQPRLPPSTESIHGLTAMRPSATRGRKNWFCEIPASRILSDRLRSSELIRTASGGQRELLQRRAHRRDRKGFRGQRAKRVKARWSRDISAMSFGRT